LRIKATRNGIISLLKSDKASRRMKKDKATSSLGVNQMRVKTLVSESTIAETAGRMPSEAFTVLDFIEVFRSLFP
jgi:hypothetical protein